MNEGEMVKLYVKKENKNEADVANAIGVSQEQLEQLYDSQTLDPGIKQKLESHFGQDIFDGSLLMEYHNDVPDQQANKPKD